MPRYGDWLTFSFPATAPRADEHEANDGERVVKCGACQHEFPASKMHGTVCIDSRKCTSRAFALGRQPAAQGISRLLATAGFTRAGTTGRGPSGFRVTAMEKHVRVTHMPLLGSVPRDRRLELLGRYADAIRDAGWACEVDAQLVQLRVGPWDAP
jgi:hypothetical protein